MKSSKVINDSALVELLNKLDDKRDDFVVSVEKSVSSYIKTKTTTQCLGLVTRNSKGIIVNRYPADISYIYGKLLFNFCLKNKINGRTIDSVLTDQIVDLVSKEYEKFFKDNNKDVSDKLSSALMQDPVFSKTLANAIVDNKAIRFASVRTKSSVAEFLAHALASSADKSFAFAKPQLDAIGPILAKSVSAIMGTTIGASIVKMVITKVVTILGGYLEIIIVKLLALPIVKAAIIAAIKKVVLIGVIAGFIQLFMTSTGIGVAGLVLIIVVTILLVYLASEWNDFPNKLGDSIGNTLKVSLSSEFRDTNRSILDAVVLHISDGGAAELGKMFSEDDELAKKIEEIADLIES